MEVGQDCFCGYYSVCAVLVTLCMCHAHRLGWVNIQRHNRTVMYQDKACRFGGNPTGISRKGWRCAFLLFSRYGSILDPYSKTVPAVIAKASAIYNPFIYAIIHSKYRWGQPMTAALTSGQETRYVNCRKVVIFNRDTLAEKVPCLHFLAQATRRECISVSQSESSLRDSMLSRHSSGCKTMFHRVMSISTTDTVGLGSLCSDVNFSQRCSLLLSKIILGVFCLLRSCRTIWIPAEVRWLRFVITVVTCSTSGATWSWTLSAILRSPATHWELWRTKNTTHWQHYQRRREAKARDGYGERLDSILIPTALSVFFFFFEYINSVLDQHRRLRFADQMWEQSSKSLTQKALWHRQG